MLLVSWNVAGRRSRLEEQADACSAGAGHRVPSGGDPGHRRAMARAARGGRADRRAGAVAAAREGSRPLAVLTAAGVPLEVVPVEDVPWPERVLRVRTAGSRWSTCTRRSARSRAGEGADARGRVPPPRRRLRPARSCGDLNTPRREHADGSVWTFARTATAASAPERGERWDAAESALIRGLEPRGFRDAFRELNGFEQRSRPGNGPARAAATAWTT